MVLEEFIVPLEIGLHQTKYYRRVEIKIYVGAHTILNKKDLEKLVKFCINRNDKLRYIDIERMGIFDNYRCIIEYNDYVGDELNKKLHEISK